MVKLKFLFTIVITLMLVAVCGVAGSLPAGAQRHKRKSEAEKKPTPQPAPTKKSSSSDDDKEIKPDSVKQDVLQKYKDQVITVRGIIGSYLNDNKTRYRFSMDDGSDVEVAGKFPDMGGTTWRIKGRVGYDGGRRNGSRYYLQEISKEAENSSSIPKLDPMLLAGGGLLGSALVIGAVMMSRSKTDQQKRAARQIAEANERARQAEMAAAVPPPLPPRPIAGGGMVGGGMMGGGGPGGTVVVPNGGGGLPKAVSPNTIISVGAIEAVSGPYSGQKFPLTMGETRIGRRREQNCDVLLDKDGEVSGYHGSVIVRGDNTAVYRDASTNGTLVDGQLVHHNECALPPGARLEIGGSTFTVNLRLANVHMAPSPGYNAPPPPAAAPPYSAPPPFAAAPSSPPFQTDRSSPTVAVPAPPPMADNFGFGPSAAAPATMASFGAEVEVASGPDAGKRFAINRLETSLGREFQDILLSDDTVSRSHALIITKNNQFFVMDQGSSHGTRINDQPISPRVEQPLMNGDRVQLGKNTIIIFHTLG